MDNNQLTPDDLHEFLDRLDQWDKFCGFKFIGAWQADKVLLDSTYCANRLLYENLLACNERIDTLKQVLQDLYDVQPSESPIWDVVEWENAVDAAKQLLED